MSQTTYGLVNAPSNTSTADGTNQPFLQGKQNELIVSALHGKYYTQAYRGNLFWGSTAVSGQTLSIVTATTNTCLILWNPQGSGKNVSLANITIGPSIAASTADAYGYGILLNAGAGIGTGAPFSAFTPITATRGGGPISITGQGASAALLGSAATLTTASTFYRTLGAGVGTGAVSAQWVSPIIREDFDGTCIIPPGTAFFVGTTIVTSGQTGTAVSCVWEEVPL